MGIGFLWCLPNCFLIDSSVEYWFANQRIVLIERFLSSNLSMQIRMNGFLHPFCLLTLMSFCHLTQRSFCTQGLLGVAESRFQKAKENLLLCEEEAWQGGWGGGWPKFVFTHRLRPSPLSRKVRVKPVRQVKFPRGKSPFSEGEGKSYGILRLIPYPGWGSFWISFLQIDQLC